MELVIMVFINNPVDVTLGPPSAAGRLAAYQLANRSAGGKTFEEAARINLIYQGNGQICMNAMCASMTGCNTVFNCPGNPDAKRIAAFCGPAGTPAMNFDGAFWTRGPADARANLLHATERELQMPVLPNPYNVVGMY